MTDTMPRPAPQRTFRLVLTPYRSLGSRGFTLLMAFLTLVSFTVGVMFLMMGAWPVFGFFGLDVLLVWAAFKVNYRAARLMETLEIAGAELLLTRTHPGGREERFSFNPYWVQVHLAEARDGRTALYLRSHGARTPFGAFLTDDERRDLSRTLTGMLAANRVGHAV